MPSAGHQEAPDHGLPASIDAERAILGGILADNDLYHDAAAGLSTDDLVLDSHRRIYRAMIDLAEEHHPIDMVTLTNHMQPSGELAKVGGASYVSSLTDGLPRRPDIAHYVSIVRDKAKLRALILLSNKTIERAREQGDLPSEIIADLQKASTELLYDIRLERDTSAAALGVEIKQYLAELRKVDIKRDAIGFRTGIRKLDIATGGFFRKEYTVIGAWTSDGKTSLAEQITVANLQDGVGVGWFSLEMFRVQIALKLIAKFCNGKISAGRLRDPRGLDMFELQDIETFIDGTLSKYNLHIDDTRGLTLTDFLARARVFVRKHNCRIIVIDYLKLLRVPQFTKNVERLSTVSGELLTFAGREDCHVLALSQLAVPEGKRKRRPTKFDVKESGDVANDAGTILMPYRPEFDEEGMRKRKSRYTGADLIIVEKQRAGVVGDVLVSWNPDSLSFDEREDKHQDE